MNISFFTNNYKPFVGGVPIAIDNLASTLRQRGHRVFIFAPEYDQKAENELDVFRIWSIKNFNDSNFVLPIPVSLETFVNFSDTESEVVHCHHPFLLGETGLHAARSGGVPIVFTYHTQYEKYAHYMPWDRDMVTELAQNVAMRFSNCCDAVIAPSTDIKRSLEERGCSVPIKVIPTGVDLRRYRQGSSNWLRQKYGIPADEKIILFVSRLAKEKNVSFLIDSFVQMLGSRDDLRLVLVGSGDDEENLKEQADSLGVSEKIIFTGTLGGRELISAYKGADLFAFASTTETQGMVVLEAMAGGLPVVAVEASGVRDVVQNGKNGFLVPDGDLSAFADSAIKILGDQSLTDEFRNQALIRARELSLTNTTRQVEELYRQIIAQPATDREEHFLILREVIRYSFQKLTDGLEALIS